MIVAMKSLSLAGGLEQPAAGCVEGRHVEVRRVLGIGCGGGHQQVRERLDANEAAAAIGRADEAAAGGQDQLSIGQRDEVRELAGIGLRSFGAQQPEGPGIGVSQDQTAVGHEHGARVVTEDDVDHSRRRVRRGELRRESHDAEQAGGRTGHGLPRDGPDA
jgi:hypothetical protein